MRGDREGRQKEIKWEGEGLLFYKVRIPSVVTIMEDILIS